MALKYSLKIKDIKWDDFKTYFDTYFFGLFKSILPKKKIKNLDDLKSPPGNRLELLKGDLDGFHSIRINSQWRIVFRWDSNAAHDVQIVDYH